jgi:hypothetical protein
MRHFVGFLLCVKITLMIGLWMFNAPKDSKSAGKDPKSVVYEHSALKDKRDWISAKSEHWKQNHVVNFDKLAYFPAGKVRYKYVLPSSHPKDTGTIISSWREFQHDKADEIIFKYDRKLVAKIREESQL